MKKLENFKKQQLNQSNLSNVFGGAAAGSTCLDTFTVYSDGGSENDGKDDCPGARATMISSITIQRVR